jgi:hypothetical protein
MAGHALMAANPNVIARSSTEDEVRELLRASGTVENVSEGEGRITRSIGSTGRALIVVSDPVRTPEQPTERRIARSISSSGRALIAVSAPVQTSVRTPEQPTERIAPEHGPDGVAGPQTAA